MGKLDSTCTVSPPRGAASSPWCSAQADPFENPNFEKPGYHITGSSEGLRNRAFSSYVNCIQFVVKQHTLVQPHHGPQPLDEALRIHQHQPLHALRVRRGVARYTPHVKQQSLCNRLFTMGQGAGSRVGAGRFQALGQLDLTCTAPTVAKSIAAAPPRLAPTSVMGLPICSGTSCIRKRKL
jgi:hypothetical protein